MASINYAAREINVKIVYYGPGLSGKTTNLQVIHRKVPPEYKSDMVSLATETDRTLFFDFLPLDLGKIKGFATKFQLYTVPGQVYYNATRKLVLRGVDGIVFVADSAQDKIQENIESFQNLEDNLAEYGYKRESIPTIIQYNKRDLPNALSIEELQHYINKYNLPWTEAIANKGIGVFDSLKLIGKIVIDYLNKKYSRSSSRSQTLPPGQQTGQPFQPQPPINYQTRPQQPPIPTQFERNTQQQPIRPPFQSSSGQQPVYQQPFRQPTPPPTRMPTNRGGGVGSPSQPLRQAQPLMRQQYPDNVAPPSVSQLSDSKPMPYYNSPQTPDVSPSIGSAAAQEEFHDHATFEPVDSNFQPQQNQERGFKNNEDYYNYGSITIEPTETQKQSTIPPQNEQYAMFDNASVPNQDAYNNPSGKTDLDLEIERYQREIEEKQRRSRNDPRIQNPYKSSSVPNQEHMQSGVAGIHGNTQQQEYEVYNIDNPSPPPFAAQQQQPVQPVIGSNEEEEMFFTSVDTDRQKKPVKRPINPRTQQQKGFLSKFFNKDMT